MSMFRQKILSIKYTLDHKKAFLKVEKELTGHNSIRGYFHDSDKIFLKLFLPLEMVSKIHRYYSRHHSKRAKTRKDYVQMIIDWECARYTKPDKPLNARDTLNKFFPELKDKILPILEDLGL